MEITQRKHEGIVKTGYDVVCSNSLCGHLLSPIIFLHGVGDTRQTWKKVVPIIVNKTGRKAYTLDARNHGDSSWMAEMNYEVLTQDLVEFMDEHGIRKAIIVGHSMGGRTAINFALKHPERTDVLVVVDMTPRNVSSGNASFVTELLNVGKELLKDLPSDMDLETAKRCFLEAFTTFANGKYLDAEKFKRHYDVDMVPLKKIGSTFMTSYDLDAAVLILTSNALVQNLPEQGLTFHGYVMFLYGSKAFFNLAEDTSINKLFPRALKFKIEDASHMIHLDSPDAFSRVVSNFILYHNLQHSKY